MASEKRYVAMLAFAQGLLLTNGVMLIAVNGLTGLALAPDRRLATVPIASYVLGSALSTLPASHFMKRYGRRRGFMTGAVFGMAGGGLAALAVMHDSFLWLCVATLLSGVYNAFANYYRFAAAEIASESFKSRAIALTLGGGLIGAFLGPSLGQWTRDLVQPRFMASYLALAALAVPAFAIAASLPPPASSGHGSEGTARPLGAIVRQPAFVVAVLAAAVGYGVMNLLMSATPIAMELCGWQFSDAAFVLQWHVIGMFAPSFVTGSLIQRFGVHRVLLAGAASMFTCVAIALQGLSVAHFFWALVLLGVGWNFLYVGGTTLLTQTYRPAERAKTQGVNDAVVFAAMLGSSLTSGAVVTGPGWATLNQLALPLLLLTTLATLTWRLRPHPAGAG